MSLLAEQQQQQQQNEDNKQHQRAPSTMRQARVVKYYPSDSKDPALMEHCLRIESVAMPVVQPNEVLVQIHAASINPVDYKVLHGYFSIVLNLPFSAGFDLAGRVMKIGENVKNFKVGDRVYAMNHYKQQGAFAEYCSVDKKYLSVIPDNVSYVEAATVPLAAETSLQALEDAKLARGQKVLVLGGSGGTGMFGVQIAKHYFGAAEVTATCSERNIEFVRQLGADKVIDYNRVKWWEELKGHNYDVIYDTVGGYDSWLHAPEVLKEKNGSYVTIAGDAQGPLSVGRLLKTAGKVVNRKFWSGFGYPSYAFITTDASGASLDKISKMMKDNQIKAQVEKVYQFDEIHQLYQHIMSGRTRGKIALQIVPQQQQQ